MRINRTYSIEIENIERLKGSGNASELINTLLSEYFNNIKPPEERLKELEHEIETKKKQHEKALIDYEKHQEIQYRQKEKETARAEKQDKEKTERHLKRMRLMYFDLFEQYNVPKDKREELFNNIKDSKKRPFQIMEELGYCKKPKHKVGSLLECAKK